MAGLPGPAGATKPGSVTIVSQDGTRTTIPSTPPIQPQVSKLPVSDNDDKIVHCLNTNTNITSKECKRVGEAQAAAHWQPIKDEARSGANTTKARLEQDPGVRLYRGGT